MSNHNEYYKQYIKDKQLNPKSQWDKILKEASIESRSVIAHEDEKIFCGANSACPYQEAPDGECSCTSYCPKQQNFSSVRRHER